MTSRISDKAVLTLVVALAAMVLMLRFPISFGGDGATDAGAPSPSWIAEQSVRLDSLRTLVDRLCGVKRCTMDISGSRRNKVLKVSSLFDKTDLLGKDWERLVREYRSERCEIRVSGDEVSFRWDAEESDGVEYVTLPLHVLHALAEIRRQ